MLNKPNLKSPFFILLPDAANRAEEGLCTSCGNKIVENDFKDYLSRKEYSISGFCQKCQDKTFRRG